METWTHGDMEKWRNGQMDMVTWTHGDMELKYQGILFQKKSTESEFLNFHGSLNFF
jgi:hypothetical protein